MSGDWKPYCPTKARTTRLEARRAHGDEFTGVSIPATIEKGRWVIRNPANGYMWTMADDAFEQLYTPLFKREEDEVRKEETRKKAKGSVDKNSASFEAEGSSATYSGPLFAKEEQDEWHSQG